MLAILSIFAIVPSSWAANENVLVFGATGSLGSKIVEELVASDRQVTAFVRPESTRERLAALDINYAVGDLMNADEVLAAISQAKFDVIVDASAKRDNIDKNFYNVAMQNIVDAAGKHNVGQIIINSSVFPDTGDSTTSDYKVPEGKVAIYAQIRREKEQAESIVINSGINYTIIRNYLLEYDSVPATGRGELTRDLNALGKITRPDLARLVVSCVGNQDCLNATFNALDPTDPIVQ